MKLAYIKTSVETARFVVHGLGLLSAIGKQHGHESVWANAAIGNAMPEADAIAITCASDAFPLAVEVAHFYKSVLPHAPIFVGGPHATFVPEDFERIQYFDYIVRGEGEVVWENYVRDGVLPATRVVNGQSPQDLNALPFVDRAQEFDYTTASEFPPSPIHLYPKPYRCVMAGRGCQYNCAFCKPGTDLIFGKHSRRRSVDSVLAELDGLNIGSLFIHDDNLIEDVPWCLEFIQRWDGRPFVLQGRADIIVRREPLLEQMATRGLVGMLIGYESGSDKVLRAMRKGTTRKLNEQAATIGHRLGITMQANMIFGTPHETKEDVFASFDLIDKHLLPCIISPAIYTPYPGSDWGKYVTEKGWNLVKDTYAYSRMADGTARLDEAALGYSYEWLYRTLHAKGLYPPDGVIRFKLNETRGE